MEQKERYIKYNEEINITIVEIKSEDQIKEKFFYCQKQMIQILLIKILI